MRSLTLALALSSLVACGGSGTTVDNDLAVVVDATTLGSDDLSGADLVVVGSPDLSLASCNDKALNGAESDVDCGGGACPACVDGKKCGTPTDCRSGVCSTGVCQAPTCSDGVFNGNEVDVDCGGSCSKCDDNQRCNAPADCVNGVCTSGKCAPSTCTDKVRNGVETDVDCGGVGGCPPCANSQMCELNSDCVSGSCGSGKTCVGATCGDLAQNGDETDVDCGGSCTANCADGQKCKVQGDCISNICTMGLCAPPGCMDSLKNGNETDVDCGGTCPSKCGTGQSCLVAADCSSMVCSGTPKKCQAPSCGDLLLNGTETDVDCGGGNGCPGCALNLSCKVGGDCLSTVCTMGKCASSCGDGKLDGSETDIDCGGGLCVPCVDGKKCKVGTDCASNVCTSGLCQTPSCSDLAKNGSESDVDCGGGCPMSCTDGKKCNGNTDCASRVCVMNVCQAPTCSDVAKNGSETDVDCGGSCSQQGKACVNGKACKIAGDCQSGTCSNLVCVAATCTDLVQNGGETDIDCGGVTTCPRCNANQTCGTGTDCQSGTCTNNKCVGASTCANKVKDGLETDVDCGGGVCPRCIYNKTCARASDCRSNVCLAGLCRPHSCNEAHLDNPSAASGTIAISPDGSSFFSVGCDMATSGGGWTIVSMNGSLSASSNCAFRLKSDAPACGSASMIDAAHDWQLAGNDMNKIPFTEVMLAAFDVNGVLVAGTRLTVAASRTVGNGAMTVTPTTVVTNTPVSCYDSSFNTLSARTAVGVSANGYSVWGVPDTSPTCVGETGGVRDNLGLNVPTPMAPSNDTVGWDDINNGCGCGGLFFPSTLGTTRGYLGLR